jgi:hypothetical protein
MASPVVVSRIQNRRGLQSQFDALYPPGYTGIGGYGSIIGFNATNFPNVLMPGELALCTDSRQMFMGNLNAEYIELAVESGLALNPLVIQLPPIGVFTAIPALTYVSTPFFTLLYDLTDDLSLDQNIPGTDFSRNGSLQITAVKYIVAPPAATLTDSGTEINNALLSTISFIAEYDFTQTLIEIKYMHDFPGNLTLSSTSLIWLPF